MDSDPPHFHRASSIVACGGREGGRRPPARTWEKMGPDVTQLPSHLQPSHHCCMFPCSMQRASGLSPSGRVVGLNQGEVHKQARLGQRRGPSEGWEEASGIIICHLLHPLRWWAMGKDVEMIGAALVSAPRAHGPGACYVPKHSRCCRAFHLDGAAQPYSIARGLVSVTASLSLGHGSRAAPTSASRTGYDQSVCFQPRKVEWRF